MRTLMSWKNTSWPPFPPYYEVDQGKQISSSQFVFRQGHVSSGERTGGGNKSTGASGGASGGGSGEAPPSVAGAKDAMICVAAWKGVAARRGKGG